MSTCRAAVTPHADRDSRPLGHCCMSRHCCYLAFHHSCLLCHSRDTHITDSCGSRFPRHWHVCFIPCTRPPRDLGKLDFSIAAKASDLSETGRSAADCCDVWQFIISGWNPSHLLSRQGERQLPRNLARKEIFTWRILIRRSNQFSRIRKTLSGFVNFFFTNINIEFLRVRFINILSRVEPSWFI